MNLFPLYFLLNVILARNFNTSSVGNLKGKKNELNRQQSKVYFKGWSKHLKTSSRLEMLRSPSPTSKYPTMNQFGIQVFLGGLWWPLLEY